MVAFWILVYIAVLFLAAWLVAPGDSYFGPIFVFAIACFVYNLAIPLEMIFTGNGQARDDFGDTWIETPRQYELLAYGTQAFIAFCVGYVLSRGLMGTRAAGLAFEIVRARAPVPLSIYALVAAMLGATTLYALGNIREMLDYHLRIALYYNSPVLSYLVGTASIYLAMLAVALIHGLRLGFVAAILPCLPNVLWGLSSGDKKPILLAALAYGTVLWRTFIARSLVGLTVLWVGAVAAGAVGIIAFSLFRGGGDLEIRRFINERGLFRWSDPAGPLLTINDLIDDTSPKQYGMTYLEGLVLWVPRAIWPTRPLDQSQLYAMRKIPNWSEGFGVGYSLLGESFTNFGAAGPLLQYVGLGLAWNLVWLGVVRRLITNDTLFMSLYAVYGYYLLIMMHRGPFSGIVTELAHTLPPLLLVHWFIDKAVIAGLSRPGIADGQGLKAR